MGQIKSKILSMHALLDELPGNSKRKRYFLYLLFLLDALATLLNLGVLYGIFYLYLQGDIHIGWCMLTLFVSIAIKLLLSYLKIQHKLAITKQLSLTITEKSFLKQFNRENQGVNRSVFKVEQLSNRVNRCLMSYFELFANLLLFVVVLVLMSFKVIIITTVFVYVILITVILNRINRNREKTELLVDKYLLKKRNFIYDVMQLRDSVKAVKHTAYVPTKFARINSKHLSLKRRIAELFLRKSVVVEVFTIFYLTVCFLSWTALYDKQQVFSLLALMVLLTAQLFPKAINIINSYHNMQDSFAFVEKYFALKIWQQDKSYQAQGTFRYDQQGLNISDLSLRYDERLLFDGAAISLPNKGYFRLKAPNGAGKSTLLKWLLEQMATTSVKAYYIPQRLHIYHGTILENIKLFAADYDREKVQQALNLSGFAKVMQDKSYTLSSIISNRELSGGEKTKLILTAMLYQRDAIEILLIDEAMANLDQASGLLFYRILNEQMTDKLIIEVSHQSHDTDSQPEIVIANRKLQLKQETADD